MRERRVVMDKVDALNRLVQPKSIAVFGGSWAHSVIDQCQKMGYEGELWPVHPTKTTVCGLPCFASIHDLPAAPDASFLGVNRDTTIELVGVLSSMNAGGAVCFAAGFSEAEEEDASSVELEKALLKAAGAMPILGPNCYGFINCVDRALLWPDQHGAEAVERGVAIITQSSNIAINLTMQTRGLPIAYVFTAGNQAQVSLAQMAMVALDDERVTAIGLHIEGFGSIREFERLALHAHKRDKKIIALKVGKTDSARKALKSHTSSLAGSDSAATAFLKRIGIKRVHSLSVFIETLKILHCSGGLQARSVLSMSCSGGEACLMADAVAQYGLECPSLSEDQFSALRVALGPRVALANPLDYHTYIWNDAQAMQGMFAGMLRGDADIAVLVLDFPRTDRCTYESWIVAIDAYKQAGSHWSGQLAVLASLPENMPESIAKQLLSDNIVPLAGLDDALAAIDASVGLGDNVFSSYLDVCLPESDFDLNDIAVQSLSEAEAKQWLFKQGVSIPKSQIFTLSKDRDSYSEQDLKEHCKDMHWPLVVKSTGTLHKSDSGGVVLGIQSSDALHSAIDKVAKNGECLIEEQVQNVLCELLVGITQDPVHGLLMTIGAGGIDTELLADAASVLLPSTRATLSDALMSLRIYPKLNGYRSAQACDIEQVLNTLLCIQDAAISLVDDLIELEINPLICTSEKVIAADAILRTKHRSSLERI